MSRYLNPYTDFGFKKLFGEEANKDLLIDFLNQLLPPQHQIAELNFKNTEQLSDVFIERRAIFDIDCISTTGERFIVEMQKTEIDFFKDRSLFYVTFPIVEQAKKGKWLFEFTPIYCIAILDFLHGNAKNRHKFIHNVALRDQDGDIFYDKLHFKFLQMPSFTKQEHELVTRLDKWLYFFKNLDSFDDIPNILNEPIFHKAFKTAALANLSKKEYDIYQQNLLDYTSVVAAVDTARKEGLIEGRVEGKLEVASNLLPILEDAAIAAATGLDLQTISNLRSQR